MSFFVVLSQVFGYAFAPDNSRDANQMHLEIHSKKPGFSVDILTIPSKDQVAQSFFDRLFFGTKNSSTEIPIQSFTIKGELLKYVGYTDGLTKSIDLNLIDNKPC